MHNFLNVGTQEENANIVGTRKNLINHERQLIYEALLQRSRNGTLNRNTTTIVVGLFNLNIKQIQAVWKKVKDCIVAGLPIDVTSKRGKKCGKKEISIDLSQVPAVPLDKRTTIRSLAKELHAKKTTLHMLFKEWKLRRHSNSLKPYLRDNNKKQRLQFCIALFALHFVII
uniref:DUF7769 domain-containing protein n=1 Tax=Arundo donax TaxID=35708 RepID=A0A0A9E4E1_ARUDO